MRSAAILAPALFASLATLASLASLAACGSAGGRTFDDSPDGATAVPAPGPEPGPTPILAVDGGGLADAAASDASFAVCASSVVEAQRTKSPVDIVWMVDNSASMQPAVAAVQSGINAFANLVGTKGLDYQVVMLSLRGTTPTQVSGSARYPVCVPPPLGGADCANGPHFFHASLDVKSTQPLEQLLGTLDQTQGYRQGETRGSEPWSQVLRAGATKTFVIVTDDESRLSAADFETFAGGANPNNPNLVLPAGVLHPSRGGALAGYSLSAIYGWGSAVDPSVKCTYPNGAQPPASGATYTQLVAKTGGVRARICDGSAAWQTFFDDVAKAVETTSRVACDIAIPPPQSGPIDPASVNVDVSGVVPRVTGSGACGGAGGWFYDDPAAPTHIVLCPATCDAAQAKGGVVPKVEVVFGCASVVR